MTYVAAGFSEREQTATSMPSSGAPFGQMLTRLPPPWAGELCVTFEVQRVILTLPTGRFVRGDEQFAIAGGRAIMLSVGANGREKRPAFV